MATELSTGAKCCRVLFIIINSLFLLIGLAILALGIWLVVIGSNLAFVTGNSYASGAAVIIVVGGITAIICLLGCIAGLGLWRGLFVVFIGFLVLLLLLEITAAVLGFVYRAKVTNEGIRSAFIKAVNQYSNASNNDATVFVNAVQNLFQCCGVDSYTDFFNTSGVCYASACNYPLSCDCGGPSCVVFPRSSVCSASGSNPCTNVNPPTLSVFNRGCYSIVIKNIDNIAYIVGGIGVVFGIMEIVAIMVACGFIICITKSVEEVHV